MDKKQVIKKLIKPSKRQPTTPTFPTKMGVNPDRASVRVPAAESLATKYRVNQQGHTSDDSLMKFKMRQMHRDNPKKAAIKDAMGGKGC